MAIEKYRVHEVAKDFGLPTKTITEILTKYAETPKNHMQVLEEDQLNLLFDVFTKSHQVASLEEALKATGEAKAPSKTAEKSTEKQENKPAEAPKAPAAKKENKPAAPQSEQKKEEPKKDERRRERRVVDTSAVTVNAERFDDRVALYSRQDAQDLELAYAATEEGKKIDHKQYILYYMNQQINAYHLTDDPDMAEKCYAYLQKYYLNIVDNFTPVIIPIQE